MDIQKATYIKNNNGWVYTGLLAGCLICYAVIMQKGYMVGAIVAALPLISIAAFYIFQKPIISFFLLFTINYFIMGITRYYLIPVGVIIDSFFGFIIASMIVKSMYENIGWQRARNGITYICLLWFLYCVIEIFNNTGGGINLENWMQGVRAMAIYPLLTVLLTSVLFKQYKQLKWFLVIWGFFIILGAAKGYWQRNHGFDPYELAWLYNEGGMSTHLIYTGIRFFSFFTDAGNFGSSMGFGLVSFSIAALFIQNKFLKIYFLIIALAGGYGMFISGTRGALAVPFAGFALFSLISKSWKMILGGIIIIISSFFFLRFTTIGENNQYIKRMRTAFDKNDPSLQVRLNNQNIIKTYMSELPWGVGIGATGYTVSKTNRYWLVVGTPPDSWLVRIWTVTGSIGLILYLFTWVFIILYGSYIIIFKIKNKELRGLLTAMLCGTFGMMISASGNEIYTQYPNCILIYTCQALVFIGPYFDKEMSSRKEKKKLANLLLQDNERN